MACGLFQVYSAKIYRQHEPGTPQTPVLNLNTVTSPEQITPYLQFFPSDQQRSEIAGALLAYLQQHRPVANIGVLAKMWRGLQSDGLEPPSMQLVRNLRAAVEAAAKVP